MRRPFLSLVLFFTGYLISAQVAPSKYFIEFTEKNGTPYSVTDPQAFLSQRAIERRTAQQIPVTEQDLPVNPSYVTQVANTGVTVLNRTKWYNGVIIYTEDSTKLDLIDALPFVKRIVKNRMTGDIGTDPGDKFSFENNIGPSFFPVAPKAVAVTGSYDYGPTLRQIRMMNGDQLHNMGYRGEGKIIAVLDGGFLQVDVLDAFDSLWANDQILGARDFVNPGGNVYQEDIHGMCVLSLMGGNIPGTIIGTAPKASYWLLRSEDAVGGSEYIIEEYNWVCAAEFADSAGADIISSSLGYTTFKDPSMDHTCAEMDGNTTPVTRGANIAFSKGMVVVCSAGNSGDNPNWQCISAPADGDDVLGIGAVDSAGAYASFSSKGVVEGNRVKPNVSAMGKKAWVYWTNNSVVQGSGTSFSCPLVAGLTACLWQAKPEVSPSRLYASIGESSSHYADPDSLTGYGIPDFSRAINILSIPDKELIVTGAFPNPFTSTVNIPVEGPNAGKTRIEVVDVMGRVVHRENDPVQLRGINAIAIKGLNELNPGFYLFRVMDGSSVKTCVAVKKTE